MLVPQTQISLQYLIASNDICNPVTTRELNRQLLRMRWLRNTNGNQGVRVNARMLYIWSPGRFTCILDRRLLHSCDCPRVTTHLLKRHALLAQARLLHICQRLPLHHDLADRVVSRWWHAQQRRDRQVAYSDIHFTGHRIAQTISHWTWLTRRRHLRRALSKSTLYTMQWQRRHAGRG